MIIVSKKIFQIVVLFFACFLVPTVASAAVTRPPLQPAPSYAKPSVTGHFSTDTPQTPVQDDTPLTVNPDLLLQTNQNQSQSQSLQNTSEGATQSNGELPNIAPNQEMLQQPNESTQSQQEVGSNTNPADSLNTIQPQLNTTEEGNKGINWFVIIGIISLLSTLAWLFWFYKIRSQSQEVAEPIDWNATYS